MKEKQLHQTFPLSRQALSQISLTSDFDYIEINNARLLCYLLGKTQSPFTAGELIAIGFIGKVFLRLIENYNYLSSTSSASQFYEYFLDHLGPSKAIDAVSELLSIYPANNSNFQTEFLRSFSSPQLIKKAFMEAFFQSTFLIALANDNPALRMSDGVFSVPSFRESSSYTLIWKVLEGFSSTQSMYPDRGVSLLDLLKKPARAHPYSIHDQLVYIRDNWSLLLGEDLFTALLQALDQIKEERKIQSLKLKINQNPLGFSFHPNLNYGEEIAFSEDKDWMPGLVLIAKNIFVWLYQLTKQYNRPIYHLDHIPDDELATLSEWGFTGLWLIGIWQRSPASQQIKQLCGSPDAIPSAYSLYDYTIADALGGKPAFEDLSQRAKQYGIRLAGDMVPNHMGLFSKWVVEYPERFLSLSNKPFPNYSYSGPDLSGDPRISLFLEDHYFDKTDAAVVFKRVDKTSGHTTFIYHGNDGTSMPWNDTAQLDFSRQEVRECVIQTIIDVAKKFPIIRFDAAMTLTKKHFHRLWFPEPGSGGAIPTRSVFGLTKTEFDQMMPIEFWREVVDRIAQEAPDTLLLAEAFWMMEGYFVRTLGMHRVYNSAFMHMLRDEDNSDFRNLIKKTLEFDPEILKRYVNFMNNPDEETAKAQFGSDGKYFGVCAIMSTIPGLPMFGHGQIEGYEEKYGMEYQRSYYNEIPDVRLIERHRREIFPLLRKRHLFAGSVNFRLYDFHTSDVSVNKDVIAFSNRADAESALIIFHNKWGATKGAIHQSVDINGNASPLLNNLGLDLDKDFLIFKDHITSLEYLLPIRDIQKNGIDFDLGAYHYHVFLNFSTVDDPDKIYSQLHDKLNGKGTISISQACLELKLDPLSQAINDLNGILSAPKKTKPLEVIPKSDYLDFQFSLSQISDSFQNAYQVQYPKTKDFVRSADSWLHSLYQYIFQFEYTDKHSGIIIFSLLTWGLFHDFRYSLPEDAWSQFCKFLSLHLTKSDSDKYYNPEIVYQLLALLNNVSNEFSGLLLDLSAITDFWFSNEFCREFINIHVHEGLSWFNQERIVILFEATRGFLLVNKIQDGSISHDSLTRHKSISDQLSNAFYSALDKSGFQEDGFRRAII